MTRKCLRSVSRLRLEGLVALLSVSALTSVNGQAFQELHSFMLFGQDGDGPKGALTQTSGGELYGTTSYGGAWDYGTVFKMTLDGQLTTMASFDATNSDQHPISGIVQAGKGDFFCVTVTPSRIVRMTPDGTLSVYGDPGGTIQDGVARGADGNLYAVDIGDYQVNYGFVFRFSADTSNGDLLFRFDYVTHRQDGYFPSGGLIQAKDSNFYGVTSMGGTGGDGVVYRITTNGIFSVMCCFTQAPGNAVYPHGRLLQASDGNFYGVADGGSEASGSIFKMTPDGHLSMFASLNAYYGEEPNGSLIEGNDGNFYGTAASAGAHNNGTVFKVSPQGALSLVLAFTGSSGAYPGASPYAGLIQASDGNLYGTCGTQGSRGAGNVFRLIMPGPLLSSSMSGGQVVLSWRTNYTGYTVQSSSG